MVSGANVLPIQTPTWSTGRPKRNPARTAVLIQQVYCPTNNSPGLNFSDLFCWFTDVARTRHLCELQTAIEKVVPLFVQLKGSFWSLRQQLCNFSLRLLSVKVIFPFSKWLLLVCAHTRLLERVSRPPPCGLSLWPLGCLSNISVGCATLR